ADVRVETVAKGERTNITVRRVGAQRYVVRGQIAAGSKPQVRIGLVDNPAAFARALFIEALRREGVDVGASVLRTPTADLPDERAYQDLARVALHRSLPLSEALKVTLKVSHNLYSSTLPLLIAAKNDKRTLAEGMRLQGKVLRGLGVNVDTISL